MHWKGENKGVVLIVRCILFISIIAAPSFVQAVDDIDIRVEEEVLLISDPHKMTDESCRSCHIISEDLKVKEATISKDVNKLCNNCHGKDEDHFSDPFPYNRETLEYELKKRGILDKTGKLNCITCHDKHSKVKNPFYLNDALFEFFMGVKKTSPHWVEGYCFACHRGDPDKSPDLFKYRGDLIKVCNNCHGTISDENYIHAVGMVPSNAKKARMPLDFKLTPDGKVSCITCHELKYQCLKKERHRRGMDPRFFRGGPYANRTDLCYKCHRKEDYQSLNPHDQINDEGELNRDVCLYCHAEEPNPQKDKGINEVKFVMESLEDLCYRCHRERPHPGGKWINFDHLVTPPKNIQFWIDHTAKSKDVILPLEPGTDQIFCCTCHNPHERGVLRGKYGKGADNDRRLRLDYGFELCDACHKGKGIAIPQPK